MRQLKGFFICCVLVTLFFSGGLVNPSGLPDLYGQTTPPAEIMVDRAVQLREQGQLQASEQVLVQALQEAPENAALHFEMANLYALYHDQYAGIRQNEKARVMLERAASELEHAVMLDPSSLPARYNLGVTHKRLGNYEKAREILRGVQEIAAQKGEPGVKFSTLMQIGSIYEEQGFFDEARDTYLEARESDYFNPAVQGALEDLERRREEYRQKELLEAAQERLINLRSGFGYSPFSHAAGQEYDRQRALGDQAGIAQAIPYLSMMLVQQFLNRRGQLQES